MIRKHKMYVRPKKAYEISRMSEENKLLEKYGLKNKREVWKTIAKVNYFRRRAKALAKEGYDEQKVLFGKLQAIGLKVNSIADVLALTVEDLLNRRLQTILAHKKFSHTAKHARQMIVHKKVLIHGNAVNIPGYIVSLDEESHLSVKKDKPKSVKEVKEEKIVEKEIKEEAK